MRKPACPIKAVAPSSSGVRIEHSFPSYPTLAEHFAASGYVPSAADLTEPEHHHLLADLFLAWVEAGQHSCQYARRLAKNHREMWNVAVFSEHGSGLPRLLNSALGACVDTSESFVALFPGISTPTAIVELLNLLCADDRWAWEEPTCDDPDRFLVALRWQPEKVEGRESWVLGFGPPECLPFTRRIVGAPFSVLALRHRWPPSNDHETFGNLDSSGLHLAQMPMPWPPETVSRLWGATSRKREGFLGDDDQLARARVTFCLPRSARAAMCDPRSPA